MPTQKLSSLALRRKRLGYEQKQLAKLLGHKTISQICRYENGRRIPNLKDALKLSMIFSLPVRVLFDNYLCQCREDLKNQLKDSGLVGKLDLEAIHNSGFCTYLELMSGKNIKASDGDKIRNHIKVLIEERSQKILGN